MTNPLTPRLLSILNESYRVGPDLKREVPGYGTTRRVVEVMKSELSFFPKNYCNNIKQYKRVRR